MLHRVFLFAVIAACVSQSTTIEIDLSRQISQTRDDFTCFTMDWWPPEKCDYGRCAWDHVSILNMDLNHPRFANAVREFSPVHLRIGGSLQDGIVYDVGDPPLCRPIEEADNRLGFEHGCLGMERWQEVNQFCIRAGCNIIFGLNQLYGRVRTGPTDWGGFWNSTNSLELLKFTQSLGPLSAVAGWSLGNEIVGDSGVDAHLTPEEAAPDFALLRTYVDELWPDPDTRPLLVGPDALPTFTFFEEFLDLLGHDTLDAMTWHEYSLGAGVDPEVRDRILDPEWLDRLQTLSSYAEDIRDSLAPNSELWLSEGGGAYNSGQHLTTNAFMSGFWWLDQIGTMARFGHQSYCRQTLIGGNYGLLNTTTLEPNPDYYSTLLWRRLMGQGVLSTKVDPATPMIRAYSHCLRSLNGPPGVTVMIMNLESAIPYEVTIPGLSGASSRSEYHFTSTDLSSQDMYLNGELLRAFEDGQIPTLVPEVVSNTLPIEMRPHSYSFIVYEDTAVPACL